jgi:ribosomal protein L11 methyltransferase
MSKETNSSYLEISLLCEAEKAELLGAELLMTGYEGIWEQEKGLKGYIPQRLYDPEALQDLLLKYGIDAGTAEITVIAPVNWNEQWEKSYDPVLVQDRCYIRAGFHAPRPGITYDIVIQPKMSFGTGHHDTTRLMAELMLDLKWEGKKTIDVGCGTGVLAILAGKMGAKDITAIDNSEWSCENTQENAAGNNIAVEVLLSSVESYTGSGFDRIISNITRNINKAHIPKYAGMMKSGGILLMSGFFDRDRDFIHEEAIKHGFGLLHAIASEKNWMALSYQKQ